MFYSKYREELADSCSYIRSPHLSELFDGHNIFTLQPNIDNKLIPMDFMH